MVRVGRTSTIRTSPTIRPSPSAVASPSDLYAGEIAFADARLGAALEELSRRGLLDEHARRRRRRSRRVARRSPGADARPVCLRLDAAGAARSLGAAGVRPGGAARAGAAGGRHADGARARRRAGRRPRTAAACGRSRATAGPSSDAGVYFEALNASLTRHWAPLTGVVHGGLKFDRPADPGAVRSGRRPRRAHEPVRSNAGRRGRLAREALVGDARRRGRRPTPAPVDRDTEQRLRSLGYVVGAAPARPARTRNGGRRPQDAHRPSQHARRCAGRDEGKTASRGRAAAEADHRQPRRLHRRPRSPGAALSRHRAAAAARLTTLEAASRAGVADAASLAALGGYLQEAGNLAAIGRGARGRASPESGGDGGLREAGHHLHAPWPVRRGAPDVRAHAVGGAQLGDHLQQPRLALPDRAAVGRGGRCPVRVPLAIDPSDGQRPQRPRRGLRQQGQIRSRDRGVAAGARAEARLRGRARQHRTRAEK